MIKLDRATILYGEKQWKQYQKDMLLVLMEANAGQNITLQVPVPESYPCLVYLPHTPTAISDTLTINCCYIYTEEPEKLLEKLKTEGTLDLTSLARKLRCYGYVAPQASLDASDEADEVVFDDDNYQPTEDSFESDAAELQDEFRDKPAVAKSYVPTSAAVLLLSLVVELRSIGALRLDHMLDTVKEIEQWMTANQEENSQLNALELLKRLWDEQTDR